MESKVESDADALPIIVDNNLDSTENDSKNKSGNNGVNININSNTDEKEEEVPVDRRLYRVGSYENILMRIINSDKIGYKSNNHHNGDEVRRDLR